MSPIRSQPSPFAMRRRKGEGKWGTRDFRLDLPPNHPMHIDAKDIVVWPAEKPTAVPEQVVGASMPEGVGKGAPAPTTGQRVLARVLEAQTTGQTARDRVFDKSDRWAASDIAETEPSQPTEAIPEAQAKAKTMILDLLTNEDTEAVAKTWLLDIEETEPTVQTAPQEPQYFMLAIGSSGDSSHPESVGSSWEKLGSSGDSAKHPESVGSSWEKLGSSGDSAKPSSSKPSSSRNKGASSWEKHG